MSEQWWYRAFSEEFGPVDPETIRELHRSGILDAHDSVRCGQHSGWRSLGSVPELSVDTDNSGSDDGFELSPGPTDAERRPKTADSPVQELWNSMTGRLEDMPVSDAASATHGSEFELPKSIVPSDVADTPQPVSRMSSAIRQATQDSLQKQRNRMGRPVRHKSASRLLPRISTGMLKGALASMLHLLALALQPVWLLSGLLRDYWIVPVTLVLIGTGVSGAIVIPQYWWTEGGVLTELQEIQQELDALRSTDADSRQWSDFSQRAEMQADTIIARLEPSADSGHPARLGLLRAARDHLPQMLQDAREAPSQAEEQFVTQISWAEHVIGQANRGNTESTDWMMPAILAADGLLLAIGGFWFFRRRA